MNVPSLDELRDVVAFALDSADAEDGDMNERAANVMAWVLEMHKVEKNPLARIKLAVAELDKTDPQIELTLAISTSHISEATNKLFQSNIAPAVLWHRLDEQSYCVSVPSDEEMWGHTLEDLDVPKDLLACMTYARERGCCRLLLDADALEAEGLPTYDW